MGNVGAPNQHFVAERVLAVLIVILLAVLCVSLVAVASDVDPSFHIRFEAGSIIAAVAWIAFFGASGMIFAVVNFSFSYLVSFYLFAVTVGFLWLSNFTPLEYHHLSAQISATISFLVFLFVALFAGLLSARSVKWNLTGIKLDPRQMDCLCRLLIVICAAVAAFAASSGLYFVSPLASDGIRSALNFPTWLNYAISISTSCLAPFSFAWFVQRRKLLLAIAAVAISAIYYPITLTKTAFTTPLWMMFLLVLLRLFNARTATILSLLIPLIVGLASQAIYGEGRNVLFRVINFRMLAIPSSGLDHYYHYFYSHQPTYFCHVRIIGALFDCTMPEQLGVVMARVYSIGNYNASLLATEGVASLGMYLAPISMVFCGLAIALGTAASSRLKPEFVFLSSAVLVQALMNVPISTVLSTHGGVIMYLLWAITPTDEAGARFDSKVRAG
jgi:hypothetical protein